MVDEFGGLKGKRIAITGGAGFIGHNLALDLQKHGAKATVIDGLQVNSLGYYTTEYGNNEHADRYLAFINERLRLLKAAKVDIRVLDVRDYHAVCKIFEEVEPEVVVHLSAIAHANRSNKDPYSTFDHSLRTLENVLDASKEKDLHLIFFSSSMVYGNFGGNSVDEDTICNPLGIYGSLKLGAEKMVLGYSHAFDTEYTIIRPSALYGERCVSRRVGQAFIENAMAGKDLTVNGDGGDALDFTYVQDLIQGVKRVIVKDQSKGEIFNLTYGAGRTLNEMAEIVLEHFPGLSVKKNPRDNLMPERGTLNIGKAKDLLGYDPNYPLEVGFTKYIEWYKSYGQEHPGLF